MKTNTQDPAPSSTRTRRSRTRAEAPVDASDALLRAFEHLRRVQWDRGCWAGEVQWCTVLLSQWVIVAHVTGQPIAPDLRRRCLQHYRAWRTPEGGFGMHAESPPYVFVTTLAYVAMRMLGCPEDDPLPARAMAWIRANGGVLRIPTWGKFWLALLGLYGWEGVNPMPPELWLMPDAAPLHPRRMYNHTRLIYLGMGYLYGRRFVAPRTPILDALRRELYEVPYASIEFGRWRHEVAVTDLFERPSAPVRAGFDLLHLHERHHSKRLRRLALDRCLEHIRFELRSTTYACVSPVNGLLNVLAVWDHDPADPDFLPAWHGVDYWSWEDETAGRRYNGAHSHTWDTAFILQAIQEAPDDLAARMAGPVERACAYLRDSQMREEIPEDQRRRHYRDRLLGGWCFSDERHRWPVSDCTAEAMSATVASLDRVPPEGRASDAMLREAAIFVLSRQNPDGGFGSYEAARGGQAILDRLNPTEMFGNCMTERSYNECTASCVAALARFRRRFPGVLDNEIDGALGRGRDLLLKAQRPDGSWEGFWGINFTYGTLFAIEGLMAAGLPGDHPAIRRACRFLVSIQRPDGGWGEHWTSCIQRSYIAHEQSQVIMTSWALMGLMRAGAVEREAVERGVRFLLGRQQPDGSFPMEGVGGVFFNTAMHHYCLYKDCFAAWALARWERLRRQPRGPTTRSTTFPASSRAVLR